MRARVENHPADTTLHRGAGADRRLIQGLARLRVTYVERSGDIRKELIELDGEVAAASGGSVSS
jgi:hypothetical protein